MDLRARAFGDITFLRLWHMPLAEYVDIPIFTGLGSARDNINALR
jgi:hypothetical protein